MSDIKVVSRTRHSGLRWRRFVDYKFTSTTNIASLAAAEVVQAALALPLAFVQRGETWSLAAVLGLLPQQNLYVDPLGNWLGRYVPAAFRSYPFLIGTQAGGQPTLCIDEASGLLTEGAEGEPFFGEAGEPSAGVAQVSSFLTDTASSEAALMQACDKLVNADIIESWPIAIQNDQGSQQVGGLFRVNENALNGLEDAEHIHLRRSGALSVAYAQLLSMGNLAQLGQLAQARAQSEAAERARAEVRPMITLPEDNTIDWDWSKVGR